MFKQKNIVLLLLLCLCACRPNTNERARDLILRYGEINYKHYQPIAFAPVKPYYVPYERNAKTVKYIDSAQSLKRRHDSLRHLIATQNNPVYLLQADSVALAIDTLDKTLAQYKQTYKPERKGWVVVHEYNQKHDSGPLTRETTVFVLDDDMKSIIETYNQ